MIGSSSGQVELQSLDDEVFAFGVSIKEALTVDPLDKIFSEKRKIQIQFTIDVI